MYKGRRSQETSVAHEWLEQEAPFPLFFVVLLRSLQNKKTKTKKNLLTLTSSDIHHAIMTVNIGYSSAFAIMAVFTFLSPEGFQGGKQSCSVCKRNLLWCIKHLEPELPLWFSIRVHLQHNNNAVIIWVSTCLLSPICFCSAKKNRGMQPYEQIWQRQEQARL